MEHAIETAALTINKKEEKKHKKYCQLSKTKDYNKRDVCNCNDVKLQLEEGKESTVIKSPLMNRKFQRREGVAEKNETERKLVKETVKVIIKGSHIDDYNFH
jgi:hypothetical protein